MTIPASEPDADTDLLAAVRAGDTAAYGTLYERHRAAARQLAYGLARDPADADDLVAETFAKVFATLRAGRGPAGGVPRLPAHDPAARLLPPGPPGPPAGVHRRPDPLRRGRAVPGPGPRPARTHLRRPRLPRSCRTRWRDVLWHTEVEGASPGRGRPAARPDPERGRRAGPPGPGGPAPALPAAARRRRRPARSAGGPATGSAGTSAAGSRPRIAVRMDGPPRLVRRAAGAGSPSSPRSTAPSPAVPAASPCRAGRLRLAHENGGP